MSNHSVALLGCIVWVALCLGCADSGDSSEGGDSEIVYGEADFTVDASISEVIPTVGIVTWSADIRGIESATISFGPDADYGMEAPVDLTESDHRTLLLGMKPSKTYHLRITAVADGITYRSEDVTVETGAVLNALGTLEMETDDDAALMLGFVVSNFSESSTVFILDRDGDYVWWYENDIVEATRARMSHDGKSMLVGANNVKNDGSGALLKVSMDGLEETTLELPGLHHDFTVLEDGTIAFIEYDEDGEGLCDRIVELDAAGERRVVYSLREDFSHLARDHEWCHANALAHDPTDDSYTLSVLEFDSIVKVSRDGELQWVLGGEESDFECEPWDIQHGHHITKDTILLFNNGGNDWVGDSRVLELALDESTGVADLVWHYEGGLICNIQGDVQRLPNGNTLVVYSSSGEWHEVNAAGDLLRRLTWPAGYLTGYADFRETLYGPPPR